MISPRVAPLAVILSAAASLLWASDASAQRGGKKPPPQKPAPPPAPAPEPPKKPKKAPTGKERIVGILDVRGPTAADEATFERNLEEQLDADAYWLAPRAIMRERLRNSTKWTEGCVVHTCLQEVKVQTSADLVVLAALTGSGTSFGYVVTLLRTDTGKVVQQESQRCDVCTFNETMNAAVIATIKLLNSMPPKLPDEGQLRAAEVDVAVQNAVKPLEARLKSARAEGKSDRGMGLAMTIIGLAVAGGGAAWYFLDDKNETALITLSGGGGLTLGGIGVLAF